MSEVDHYRELAQRPVDLEQRLAALEATSTTQNLSIAETSDVPEDHQETFWVLEGLKQRAQSPSGSVLLTGAVQTPMGQHAHWHRQITAQELFDTDFGARADSLSALGHPVQLRLLQRLLTDACTIEDIRESGDFGTNGQIYHHLRQLVATGWVRLLGSSKYEVPPARIVPLLTILLGVDR
ncbi:helix-turn-helix domain-containing protein [Corynebacterium alimapuense]|uniref:ArsR family transcriptional regulator n=1 Tax=Corynebacterium alimapuense TaxID=1576874 RepID=A0A3M8K572_9CORY|nr:helix-turn-helix domain-containing protein [Corynebacterium alimapuense]RNE48250.1 ArsR family transcriptional regulator [Corynebacterium alimapuense]